MSGEYYNADVWNAAAAAYRSPGRVYHNEKHLADVMAHFREVAGHVGWWHPQEVCLALIFHDVVYVAGASDNEAKSADFARKAIKQFMPDSYGVSFAYVDNLIRLTAGHGKLSPDDVSDEDALFLDCDMAVLGGSSEAFDAYDAGIAAEYAAVPPEAYKEGRLRFLEGLLAKDRIFLSPYFYARYDHAAHENLRRAIARLKDVK